MKNILTIIMYIVLAVTAILFAFNKCFAEALLCIVIYELYVIKDKSQDKTKK